MLQEIDAIDLLPPHRKQSLISNIISPTREKKESCGMTVLIDEAKNVIDRNASVRSAIIVHVMIGHVRTGATCLITK